MTESLLNTPALWINEYLKAKLSSLIQTQNGNSLGVPFFPSKPGTIDELTEQWVTVDGAQAEYSGVMATWDRLIRMNRRTFPHIKQEQMLYYFYATQDNVTETMVQIQEAVLRLMDRLDESAEELNNWAKGKQINVGTTINPVYIQNKFMFHDFKVYQLEEVRDIIDFGTARTYGGNKMIIDYSYHQMPDLTMATWSPKL